MAIYSMKAAAPGKILGLLDRSHLRSLAKAISWRVVGALDTLAISWFITGSFALASGIVSIELFTKVSLYYAHERAWNRVR